NIRQAIGHTSSQAPIVLPEPPASPQAQVVEATALGADDSNVVRFSRRARLWRNVATAAAAIAATLLAIIGVQIFMPDLLPNSIRPKPRTEVVQIKTPPTQPGSQYVALVQGQSGGPAFILTIDGATRNFTVRKVGAPAVEAGKSYELWLISDKLGGRPRSLGVIGASDFVERPGLAGYGSDVTPNATFAGTLEQAGGSPDGAPHSTPLFVGKLIETVPPSPPAQNR